MNRLWRARFVRASQDGQLYLVFGVRVDEIRLMGLRLQVKRSVRSCLRWLRSVFLFPLWISFEIPIALWDELEYRASRTWGMHLLSWHRFLFCLVVSLTVVQFGCLRLSGAHLGPFTVLLSGAHGLALQFLWRKGARWCEQILGVRPIIYADDQEAYDHLEFS